MKWICKELCATKTCQCHTKRRVGSPARSSVGVQLVHLVYLQWGTVHGLHAIHPSHCSRKEWPGKDLGRLAYIECLQLFPKALKSVIFALIISLVFGEYLYRYISSRGNGEICFTMNGMWAGMIKQSVQVLIMMLAMYKALYAHCTSTGRQGPARTVLLLVWHQIDNTCNPKHFCNFRKDLEDVTHLWGPNLYLSKF